jgi:hypothetical protein
MNAIRHLFLKAVAVASLCVSFSVRAQTNSVPSAASPIVVVQHGTTNLAGVPKAIKSMIIRFDQTRDQYLASQNLLLIQLKHATTAAEREQIRALLQANRQAFLDTLKSFRQQIKEELTALKGKISHEEFLRVIDAAQSAETEGGLGHHKGH